MFSRAEINDIPVVLQAGFSKQNAGDVSKIQVVAKIDVSSLHFRKVVNRDSGSLRVVAALFDPEGGYLTGSAETVSLKLQDGRASQDLAVTLRWEFDAKAGSYLVRLVVREAQGKAMTSLNREVKIP